jgi:hypothetical protein
MNGDQVASGLGENIRVCDYRVIDESWKRMIGQIRRETPLHVVERAVDLKRVRDLEFGRDVPQRILKLG